MIHLFSFFVTDQRTEPNRYPRYDIFKYMLYSYRNTIATEIYIFMELENGLYTETEEYIYKIFSKFPKDKVHITWARPVTQDGWKPIWRNLMARHGPDELIWFTSNDDHVFIDYNMDIVKEGLEILKTDPARHKSIYYSHWPEILNLSGKFQVPEVIGNFIKFNTVSLLDGLQIFNLQFLYDIYVEHEWKGTHRVLDSLLNEFSNRCAWDNPLEQVIYAPLRELVRHFDGYRFAGISEEDVPPFILPSNAFTYSREALTRKMTAQKPNRSGWSEHNQFVIPQEWIEKCVVAHSRAPESYTVSVEEIPISLGWNCGPATYRASLGFRKASGYKTCPFDLGVTPYAGLVECILDKFDRKKFFNLRVEYDPVNKQDCILNEYDMWFNHESERLEGNSETEWHPGKWAVNDFYLFKERYENRIQNFLNYVESGSPILFLYENPRETPEKIKAAIETAWPGLIFRIKHSSETTAQYIEQYKHSPGFPSPIPYFRAVMLVLASDNNQIYRNCRRVWKQYMLTDPRIKVFFVYGSLSAPLYDYDPESDLIFPAIPESYPVLVAKTIEAMKIIHSSTRYDFFIRTNLTTFWDFENLHKHLTDLPATNCYSGDGPLPHHDNPSDFYLSGTDTIVTPDMIESITTNEHLIEFSRVEDGAMGKYFHGVLGAPLLPNRICFFEDVTHEDEKTVLERIEVAINSGKDHYRVKTLMGDREKIDFFIYKQLLSLVYNIKN